MTSPADRARAGLAAAFGSRVEGVAWAPGRVNLIGEHTDYNDGFVLPMAIGYGVSAAFAPRTDGLLRAHSVAFGETREAAIDALAPDPGGAGDFRGHWFAYVAGVVWAMRRAGLPLRGFDVAIAGDVPIGAWRSPWHALRARRRRFPGARRRWRASRSRRKTHSSA